MSVCGFGQREERREGRRGDREETETSPKGRGRRAEDMNMNGCE